MAAFDQHMKQSLLTEGSHTQRGQVVSTPKIVGIFATGTLLGALMGAGMVTFLATPSSPVAVAQRPSLRLFSDSSIYGPQPEEVENDAIRVSAHKLLHHDSKVDPVQLRFDNTCFWKKQDRMLQQLLMKDYVSEQLASRQAEVEATTSKSKESKVASSAPARFLRATDPLHRNLSQSLIDLYEVGPSASSANMYLAFQEHCQKWVAQTTDATWHSTHEADREQAVEKYFAPDFVSHIYGFSVGGRKGFRGRDTLKTMIKNKLKTFPDLKIRILDTLCTPAVHDDLGTLGFFTTMPDLSEGTMVNEMSLNLTQADGSVVPLTIPASGKRVAYAGNAVTFVAWNDKSKNWQYQGEWVMHGEMEMFAQMNALSLVAPHASGVAERIVNDIAPKVEECQVPHLWYGDVPVTGPNRINVLAEASASTMADTQSDESP